MQPRPFQYEGLCSSGQASGQLFDGVDAERCPKLTVPSMEMGWAVLRDVHVDDDSVELADPWHSIVLTDSDNLRNCGV